MNPDTGVWLIDASALIGIKIAVPQAKQWGLFRHLEGMVEEGRLAYPRQVRAEMQNLAHPDAPGVWADGVFPAIKHPVDVDHAYVRQVMSSPAKAVVDPNKTREDADPYLIAMALQLMASGVDVCVVTEDHNDTPARIGLTQACDLCAVAWERLDAFLRAIGHG